jgi:eukaryotic-like serine/threonine-protein kinase
MSLETYELLAQVGAGRDGVTYRARRPDGRIVELRSLAGARADELIWEPLRRHLRRVELLHHGSALSLNEIDLDSHQPFLALEYLDSADVTPIQPSQPIAAILPTAVELAAVFRAAHRLGVSLAPIPFHHAIRFRTISLRPVVDFTATRCREEDINGSGPFNPAADVLALAEWLLRILTGETDPSAIDRCDALLRPLLRAMLTPEPTERPQITEIHDRLCLLTRPSHPAALGETNVLQHSPVPPPIVTGSNFNRQQLGRFRLVEKLGQGGMGEVYKGEDVTDGKIVALKILRGEWSNDPLALSRLLKEATLLREVSNPYVANLLEINEDDGLHYLVIEYIAGQSLDRLLQNGASLPEDVALSLIADVCRALADAHTRGIVHRDIKPDNILLENELPRDLKNGTPLPRARLSDFGLARHVVEKEALNLTRTGVIIGTPLYLSPEQGGAPGPVDARSDIYSMGATLFHMLIGRPPFLGDTPLALISKHCNEPPPSPAELNPSLSAGACLLVEKALAKKPDHRQPDAGAFLAELTRVLSGEPLETVVHPRLPAHNPARVVAYHFEWQLKGSPEHLWPFVSNTERLNRAIGLPAVPFSLETDSTSAVPELKSRPRRFGRLSRFGIEMVWEEHPFEWVEGRRFGVLREFRKGPFCWFLSRVELLPRPDGGTTLRHLLQVEPGGLLGRLVAAIELGRKARFALDRVYRRIDDWASSTHPNQETTDPFEEAPPLTRSAQRYLEQCLERLTARGGNPLVAERLGTYLASAPTAEVSRIRPLALARRLKLEANAVVEACLRGAREGLLVLMWDLVCPLCRAPSEVQATLKQLHPEGRCDVCQIDYELDFGSAVEMVFRIDPAIRAADTGTYCVGAPARSPHVVVQVRMQPHERIELPLTLAEGAYRLRGPQLPESAELRVVPGASLTTWEVDLSRLAEDRRTRAGQPVELRPGGQTFRIVNGYEAEVLVRLERIAAREDAFTAARASALALFRELFPGEVLSPGQLVRVSSVTLLWTDLGPSLTSQGEERAFSLLHEHLQSLEGIAAREGGALLKSVGDGALAAFHTPTAAMRAALALVGSPVRLRAALHAGAALAATVNGHLDYYGSTVRQTAELVTRAQVGELLVGQAVLDDPRAAALMRERGLTGSVGRTTLAGEAGVVVHRFAKVW